MRRRARAAILALGPDPGRRRTAGDAPRHDRRARSARTERRTPARRSWLPQAAARVGLDADAVAGWSDDRGRAAAAPRTRRDRRSGGNPGHRGGDDRSPSACSARTAACTGRGRGPWPNRCRSQPAMRSLTTSTTSPMPSGITARAPGRPCCDPACAPARSTGRGRCGRARGHPCGRRSARPGCARRGVAFAFAELLAYVAFVASWAVLGRAALSGRIEGGCTGLWALLLTLSVGLRLTARWLEGVRRHRRRPAPPPRVLVGALRPIPTKSATRAWAS